MTLPKKSFQFSSIQKTLLGIALMSLVVHGLLKLDEVKQALDVAYIYFRMGNSIIGLSSLLFSGWEGVRGKKEVENFIKSKTGS